MRYHPMHRSHEHLAKIAIEICDGLLIHQVLGALKPGDIPAKVRVDAIDALVQNYFVPGTAIGLSLEPDTPLDFEILDTHEVEMNERFKN